MLYYSLCTKVETTSHVEKFIMFGELQVLFSWIQISMIFGNLRVWKLSLYLGKLDVAEICGRLDSHAHMIEQKYNPPDAQKLFQDSTRMADLNQDSSYKSQIQSKCQNTATLLFFETRNEGTKNWWLKRNDSNCSVHKFYPITFLQLRFIYRKQNWS